MVYGWRGMQEILKLAPSFLFRKQFRAHNLSAARNTNQATASHSSTSADTSPTQKRKTADENKVVNDERSLKKPKRNRMDEFGSRTVVMSRESQAQLSKK